MRVRLCGAFALEPRASAAALPGGQARQVLTYLAARPGRMIRRDVLADVLWPIAGTAPQDPDAVLSSLLSRLRPLIAPARVRSSGGGVALELPEGSTVDVEEAAGALERARAALAAGRADEAAAAAGEALAVAEAGFLPEQQDDWTAGPRELVRTLRLDALEVQANAAVLRGDGGLVAGEAAARIAVALAPLRESAHVALMRVLAERGNAAEALRIYERLRRRLMDELGVAPSPELRALHGELVAGPEDGTSVDLPSSEDGESTEVGRQAAALPRPALPPVVRALGSGEAIGRAAPLRQLRESVALVRRDGPRAAVILSEPGMGASRLACVFARELYDEGAFVLFGRAEPDAGDGASALREAFAPLVGEAGGGVVAGDGAAGGGVAAPDDLLRAACARLVEAAREQLVVVVIDDAEALDDSGARLLRLVLEEPAAHLLLVLTAGARALRGGSATWHVLDRLRQVARRDDVVLDDLDGAQVAALVADALPDAPAELAPALHDYVGGHPVLVREAVVALEGVEDPVAALERVVPPTLRASVAQRYGRLDDDGRRVVRAVAAIGSAAAVGRLALLLELPRERIVDAVSAAGEARLLRLERDGRHVAFNTRAERDVIVAALPRAELAREAAEAVALFGAAATEAAPAGAPVSGGISADPMPSEGAEVTEVGGADEGRSGGSAVDANALDAPGLGRLALRAIPAMAADDAAALALRGVQELLARRDFAPAAALADAALAVAPAPPLRARLLLAAGEATRRVAAGPARRAFAEALRLAGQQRDGVLMARAALGLAALGEGSVNRGLGPAARTVLDALVAADRALPPDQLDLRAELLARLALERSWEPDAREAQELLERARALLTPETPAATRRVVEQAELRVDATPERTARRLVVAGRLLDDARSAHDRAGEVAAITARLPLLGELGRFESLREELALGRRLAAQLGDPRFLRWAGEADAMLAAMAGEPARAARLRSAALRAGGDQPVASEPFALEQLIHRLDGGADATAADLAALAEIAERRPDLVAVRVGAALLHAQCGQPAAARELLAPLPHDADGLAMLDRSNGMALVTWSLLAATLWRLGERERAAPLLTVLAPYADRHALVFLPGYFGPVAEALGLLELLLDRPDAAARRLHAAHAAALAAGAPAVAARIAAAAAPAR